MCGKVDTHAYILRMRAIEMTQFSICSWDKVIGNGLVLSRFCLHVHYTLGCPSEYTQNVSRGIFSSNIWAELSIYLNVSSGLILPNSDIIQVVRLFRIRVTRGSKLHEKIELLGLHPSCPEEPSVFKHSRSRTAITRLSGEIEGV